MRWINIFMREFAALSTWTAISVGSLYLVYRVLELVFMTGGCHA